MQVFVYLGSDGDYGFLVAFLGSWNISGDAGAGVVVAGGVAVAGCRLPVAWDVVVAG
jgi:hypothetical protein